MADTKRLTMLKALTTRLQGITTAAGFVLDLEGRVFRGRTAFGKETPVPFISILEEPEQPETVRKGGADIEHIETTLWVQGFAADDKENPTDPAYALLGCILKALAPLRADSSAARATDGVIELDMSAGYVRPPDEKVSKTAYCVVEIKPTYKETIGDPYT